MKSWPTPQAAAAAEGEMGSIPVAGIGGKRAIADRATKTWMSPARMLIRLVTVVIVAGGSNTIGTPRDRYKNSKRKLINRCFIGFMIDR